jgi:hypothetical protein
VVSAVSTLSADLVVSGAEWQRIDAELSPIAEHLAKRWREEAKYWEG